MWFFNLSTNRGFILDRLLFLLCFNNLFTFLDNINLRFSLRFLILSLRFTFLYNWLYFLFLFIFIILFVLVLIFIYLFLTLNSLLIWNIFLSLKSLKIIKLFFSFIKSCNMDSPISFNNEFGLVNNVNKNINSCMGSGLIEGDNKKFLTIRFNKKLSWVL
jgi:hypothetical protein